MSSSKIKVSEEDLRLLKSALKVVRRATQSEAVTEAISELQTRSEPHQARLGDLLAKVVDRLEHFDRGEGRVRTVRKIRATGKAFLAAKRLPARKPSANPKGAAGA